MDILKLCGVTVLMSVLGCSSFSHAAPDAQPASVTADIVGEAVDSASGKLLYREYYYLNDQSRPDRVDYRLADGRLLASKSLRFDDTGELSRLTRPSIQHRNELNGRLMEVDSNGEQLTVRYRDGAQDSVDTAVLKVQSNSVVDAGFDEFVRQNWNLLLDGQSITMNFLAPSRQSFVVLELRYLNSKPFEVEGDVNAVWIQARPASGILRLFVDPIDLYYQRDSRRLIRYSGISNLTDASGSSMKVNISYQYVD